MSRIDPLSAAWRTCLAAALLALALPAAALDVVAADSGFVTEAGGSSKGDATVAPGAKYNYSAGFELHYGAGALFTALTPMFRRNYFVFDLAGMTVPVKAAALKLYTGTLESADASELFELHATSDTASALALAAALGAGSSMSEFDAPADPLVTAAKTLYTTLGGGAPLAAIDVTHAMDASFAFVVFTPAGIDHLNAFLGSKVILGGLVPTALPPAFPQQPFGFTGPDIPGGGPLVPTLMLIPVPELPAALLLVMGLAAVRPLVRQAGTPSRRGPGARNGQREAPVT